MNSDIIRSICFECHSRCGVLLEVEDGRIVGVKGDKGHPFSRGYMCPKGRAIKEIIYHPDRITKPLKRVGDRGEGNYEPISWDQALELISKRLLDVREKWGAEALAAGVGTTRGIPPFLNRFIGAYGTPNYFGPGHMSGGPVSAGGFCTAGLMMIPDYQNSKCIMLWAHNPDHAFPGLYKAVINDGLENGSKLIVVDPRGTPLAKKADHWLRVRPGTDVALALCFLHIVIKNKLYDEEFVDQWTIGFDQLRDHVADCTPEWCAGITWVPADKIEAAAMTYATTQPACIGPGIAGGCQMTNAYYLNRAITSLAAITGNLEVPGGNPKWASPLGVKRNCYGSDFNVKKLLSSEQAQKKLGLDRYPIEVMIIMCPSELVYQAVLEEKPYPVKAIGLFASNALCSHANSPYVKKAFAAVDFMFAVDYFHTPTTAMADIILPPAHWTERDDVEDLMMMNHLFCQPKAVEPVPECRDEKQILIDLATRMGLEGLWDTVEEGLNYRLEPIGMTFEEFKKVGKVSTPVIYKSYEKENRFMTFSGSGKVDLYSEYTKKMGGSPLPFYREPSESPVSTPGLYQEYPLILTTGGRILVYYHCGHRNIPSLKKLSPDPLLDIHPETAAAYQVEDGEWVKLLSPRGGVEIKIRFNGDMHPKVVHAPHGYWYGLEDGWERLNINQLTDNKPQCDVTGAVPTRQLLCRIEKINDGA